MRKKFKLKSLLLLIAALANYTSANALGHTKLNNDDAVMYQSSEASSTVGDLQTVVNYLENAEHFYLPNYQCEGIWKNKELNLRRFRIRDLEIVTKDLTAHASAPNITKSEFIYGGEAVLVNHTDLFQTIQSSEFDITYSQSQSTSTMHAWNVGFTISGSMKTPEAPTVGGSFSLGYNGSVTNATESSEAKKYTAKASGININPHSYALVTVLFKKTTLAGDYTFSQTMSGTMNPRYDIYCGGWVMANYDRPTYSINHFLNNNYKLESLPSGMLQGPDTGKQNGDFYLKGYGKYTIDTGSDFRIDVYSCSKDSDTPPCDHRLYEPAANSLTLRSMPNNIKTYDVKSMPNKIEIDVRDHGKESDSYSVNNILSDFNTKKISTTQVAPKPDLKSPF
ncbi:MAG: ETX/MTX2 family pore-forming toxin [Neisseriaceae bacterium]